MSFLEKIKNTLSQAKFNLTAQYQAGAREGKQLKKKHKEKIFRKKNDTDKK